MENNELISKIEKLINAVFKEHPRISFDGTKQPELYKSLHDLNNYLKDSKEEKIICPECKSDSTITFKLGIMENKELKKELTNYIDWIIELSEQPNSKKMAYELRDKYLNTIEEIESESEEKLKLIDIINDLDAVKELRPILFHDLKVSLNRISENLHKFLTTK
jgi:hypothetical protein